MYNNNMNNRVTVSSKAAELIYSNRICCYDNERLDIKIKLTNKKEDELKICFIFKYTNTSGNKVNVNNDNENGIIVELINFTNPLGTGLKKPVQIARYGKKNIAMLFNVYRIGESNPILDLSLYLERSDG